MNKLLLFFTLICTIPLGAMQQNFIVECTDDINVIFRQSEIDQLKIFKANFTDTGETTFSVPFSSEKIQTIQKITSNPLTLKQQVAAINNADDLVSLFDVADFLDATFLSKMCKYIALHHPLYDQLSQQKQSEIDHLFCNPLKNIDPASVIQNGMLDLSNQNLQTLSGIEKMPWPKTDHLTYALFMLEITMLDNQIEYINLSGNKLKKAELALIRNVFPYAKFIELKNNNIATLEPSDIECLQKGTQVLLKGNPITTINVDPKKLPWSFYNAQFVLDQQTYNAHKNQIKQLNTTSFSSKYRKLLRAFAENPLEHTVTPFVFPHMAAVAAPVLAIINRDNLSNIVMIGASVSIIAIAAAATNNPQSILGFCGQYLKYASIYGFPINISLIAHRLLTDDRSKSAEKIFRKSNN